MKLLLRHTRQLAAALALTCLLAQGLAAQTAALYALNESGRLTLNATTLDSLSGSTWVDMLIDGSDRYALRNDGRVMLNGVKLYDLECEDGNGNDVDEGTWVALAQRDGSLWALSTRGYLARDGLCVTQFNQGLFFFTELFAGETDGTTNTWAMRSDGALFVNQVSDPIFQLEGGRGVDPEADGEGQASDTRWQSGAVRSDGMVFAMRRDGKVVLGTFLGGGGTPFSGTIVAELPFADVVNSATLYADFLFRGDDKWIAIRGSGKTYSQDNTLSPFIEFNGNSQSGKLYVDLMMLPADMEAGTTDMSFMALRQDGKIYRETDVAAVAELPKSGYGVLGFSTEDPDLTNAKNTLPEVSKYTVQAVTGTPFTFPILATDVDKAQEDLIVTVDPLTLPEGATYDPVTRTVTWLSPVKGSAKIKIEVDDGVGKPVKKTFKVKVRDPPENPEKNIKPRAGKIKGTQALVGIELRLPILASDQNGDKLTMTVDETLEPFTLGATFDPMTNTFIWSDPQLADIGTYSMKFQVSDGIKTVNRKVKVKLVSSFLGF